MKPIGIEDMSAYLGLAGLEVDELFAARGLAPERMANLMMVRKTVALPGEDVITYAVNAARPLLARLTPARREAIELLVVGTESGVDLSKAAATWIHRLLDLPRTCRLFEVKQACYAGVAALQLAIAHMATAVAPDARALVIGCDVPQLVRGSMAEPSQGAGALAVLVGPEPRLTRAEPGAAGYCAFEVADVYRPTPHDLVWDSDLSLLSYVDCLKSAYSDYARRRPGTDFFTDFAHLAFHTPFPGAVKGAHRSLLRSLARISPQEITEDFEQRLAASLRHPAQVGNAYAATALLALLSVVDHVAPESDPVRVGLFSYGSGCSSEFSSQLLLPAAGRPWQESGTAAALERRVRLDVAAYDGIADASEKLWPGVPDHRPDLGMVREFAAQAGAPESLVVLKQIEDHRRVYTEIGPAR
ncbi:hydroxymethylglutaryl-CoA synthase [Streptomyces sp. NPDC048278]|uniref:hydroxymethylglutaryl-CoA synthase family protein n=1 Tax=Streptomyces sp. NPDC048278 TaxID=3155809 RepID=UPI00341E741D